MTQKKLLTKDELKQFESQDVKSLSDKIIAGDDCEWNNGYISALDVKEFIKRQLCSICQKYPENNCVRCNKIKKDAGDKLSK